MDLPVFNRKLDPAVKVPSLCLRPDQNAAALAMDLSSNVSSAAAAEAKADEIICADIEVGVKKRLRILIVDDSSANRSANSYGVRLYLNAIE